MTDEQALLRAVLESPADDLPRLVLADWWEEHGRAERAEFVRLQVQIRAESAGLAGAVGRWTEAEVLAAMRRYDRQRELLSVATHDDWAGFPPAWGVTDWRFDRGFVDRVELPAAAYLRHAATLFGRYPIAEVRFTDAQIHSWYSPGYPDANGITRADTRGYDVRLPLTVERARRRGCDEVAGLLRALRWSDTPVRGDPESVVLSLDVDPGPLFVAYGRHLAGLSEWKRSGSG